MNKLAFIYNPLAGKGGVKEGLSTIVEIFSHYDYEVTCIPTKGKNYCAKYLTEHGREFETAVVAGGDGTVNEAFNALCRLPLEDRPVLGYIPMGTTNDFASSCNLPLDIVKAAKIAVSGKETYIDSGRFNHSYFAYVAACGAFTSVSYGTKREAKSMFGYAAYVFEGIKSISSIKAHRMKISYKDVVLEDDFIFGMVANSKSVGGVNISDKMDVDLSDGLFEVLFVKKFKPTEINLLLADLRNRREESRFYHIFKTDKMEITSQKPVAWTLDGEFGGEETDIVIENVPSAIKIRIEE